MCMEFRGSFPPKYTYKWMEKHWSPREGRTWHIDYTVDITARGDPSEIFCLLVQINYWLPQEENAVEMHHWHKNIFYFWFLYDVSSVSFYCKNVKKLLLSYALLVHVLIRVVVTKHGYTN